MTEMSQIPPPPYSKGGYSKLPQSDDPYGYSSPQVPQPAYPPPAMGYTPGYAPAPPVFQQQSNNTNVVVVGQPSSVPQTTVVRPHPHANEYLALTLVLMVLCFIHGNLLAFFCLVPALICSCVASDHNNAGQFADAKQCGNMALCCNICAIVKYAIAVLAAVVLVIVYFTVGFSWLHKHVIDQVDNYVNNHVDTNVDTNTYCYKSCSYDSYGYYTCSQVCY